MNRRTKDIIMQACEQLNCKYEDYSVWFEILVFQSLRTMNSAKILTNKSAWVEVYDNKATLPPDVIDNLLVAEADDDAYSAYCANIDYFVQGDLLIFIDDLIDDETEVFIKYRGLSVDDNGDVIIPEKWERAIVAYLCWKFGQRHPDRVPRDLREEYRREFVSQKAANR